VSAPGSCRRSDATGIRGLDDPSSSGPWAWAVGDMPVSALGPGHALALALPSTLPSTLSATSLSAGVVRGFIGTLRPSDSSSLPRQRRPSDFLSWPGIAVATAGSTSDFWICDRARLPAQGRRWVHLHSPAPDGVFRDVGADGAGQGRVAAVPQVGNHDYKFCVGTHRSSRKVRFSGRGCLTRSAGRRIAIAINLIRLRAMGIRSPARALHKGGPRVRCRAIGAAGHGTRRSGFSST
jgi:hypothetical protein